MPKRGAASKDRQPGGLAPKSYAITVDFQLRPDCIHGFLELVRENAFLSIRDEPLCTRFDVLVPRDPKSAHVVTLYELYADRAAFDHHLSTAHFLEFDKATRDMVLAKTVLEFDADENAKPTRQ
jgi:quinol monooxygenase YgiN